MGLFSKLTGSKAAADGVDPVPVEQLRNALLGLNRSTAPWEVHSGEEEDCDLIAEWRIVDASWHGVFSDYGLSKSFRVLMKFDVGAHEVRHIDEQTSVEWNGDGTPSVDKSWSRGQINEVEYGKGIGYTETDDYGTVYEYKFRSKEIKDPLGEAVTSQGWGWKGVTFRF